MVKTRFGKVIGGDNIEVEVLEKFNRRKPGDQADGHKRISDYYFEPVEKVFYEFRRIYKIYPIDINSKTYEGKRLRGNLLVYLKDRAGLKYSEIINYPIFSDVKLHSLGKLYRYAKLDPSALIL